jgi:hypothetical protein
VRAPPPPTAARFSAPRCHAQQDTRFEPYRQPPITEDGAGIDPSTVHGADDGDARGCHDVCEPQASPGRFSHAPPTKKTSRKWLAFIDLRD